MLLAWGIVWCWAGSVATAFLPSALAASFVGTHGYVLCSRCEALAYLTVRVHGRKWFVVRLVICALLDPAKDTLWSKRACGAVWGQVLMVRDVLVSALGAVRA